MIDITLLARERLLDRCRHLLPVIGLAAAYAALAALPKTMPAAYVLPLGETGGASDANEGTVQFDRCTFGVVLMVQHAGDLAGAKATAALQQLRVAVQAVLVGWQPVPTTDLPLEFAGGALLSSADSAVIWRDDFSLQRLRVAAHQAT